MEVDEEGIIARQRLHRGELIDPAIAEHDGRIVKTTGDGLLVEFSSVVDAVRCAVTIQRAMAAREANMPEEQRLRYRVGINLGDIVVDEDDIYGDGVNVAARLEALAEPEGICISGTAYDHLRSNVEVGYESLGEVSVKNIERPIRAYKVLMEPDKAGAVIDRVQASRFGVNRRLVAAVSILLLAGIFVGGWWWSRIAGLQSAAPERIAPEASGKPSIAVLPFNNLSDSLEREYFADGLADDLITDLSRISGLVVISRTSSFAFKGQAMDVREIGTQLGAGYIVEGTVRKIGEKLRITAQLTDAGSGGQLWADRYDRDMAGLFEFQETVRNQIVQSLSVKLSAREQNWLARRPTTSPKAYDFYLRGLKQESFFTRESNIASRRMFQRAVELDPSFAAAYSKLAQAYSLAQENRWTDQREVFARKAIKLAEKAVMLDDELPQAFWALSRIYSRQPFSNPEKSMQAIRRTLALDPNFADGYAFLASRLTASGKAEEALSALEKAMRINPNFPFWYLYELGRAQFFLTRYDAAVQSFQKAIERNPAVGWPRRWLIAAYGHLGNLEDAEWEMLELESTNSHRTVSDIEQAITVTHPRYRAHFLDGLRKAGMSEN
jgi:adenylate cyclase